MSFVVIGIRQENMEARQSPVEVFLFKSVFQLAAGTMQEENCPHPGPELNSLSKALIWNFTQLPLFFFFNPEEY